jgi:hypothetical protein
MYASQTSTKPSVVWQGSTKDGYTLGLTRSALTQIISQLKQTGLEHLVRRLRSNNQGSLESAVLGAIAQVVSNATRSRSGQNTQVFTAVGKTRKYQIATQPIGHQQGVIIFVRSRPTQEFEYEGEYEGEYENEYEGEYERELANLPIELVQGIAGKLDNQSLRNLSQTSSGMRGDTEDVRKKRVSQIEKQIRELERRRSSLTVQGGGRANEINKQLKLLRRQRTLLGKELGLRDDRFHHNRKMRRRARGVGQ